MRFPAIATASLFLPCLAARADTPAVSIDHVVRVAQTALAKKNVEGVYIQSVELAKPAVFSGQRRWVVKWSEPVPATTPQNREIGLSVGMDGKVIHLVK